MASGTAPPRPRPRRSPRRSYGRPSAWSPRPRRCPCTPNTYQVEPALAGRKVELVFSPFDLTRIEVRHHDHSYGLAVPHLITRHAHPKARPETPEPPPAPATGIAYLDLVTAAHHEQIAADARIGFQALYSPQPDPN